MLLTVNCTEQTPSRKSLWQEGCPLPWITPFRGGMPANPVLEALFCKRTADCVLLFLPC